MNVAQLAKPGDSFNLALETFIPSLLTHDLLFFAGTDDRTTWPKLSSSDEPAAIYWRIRDIVNFPPNELLKPAGTLMAAALHLIIKQLGGDENDYILAPVPQGAVQLTGAASVESNIRGLTRRDEEKTHGTGGKFIGNMDKRDEKGNLIGKRQIILLDDVITSGGNIETEREKLYTATGEWVGHVLVVCDRRKPGTKDPDGTTVYSCFTQKTALDLPVLKNHPDRARVDKWLAETRWPKKER